LAIGERLAAEGITCDVLSGWLPRQDFAARLRAADVFVGLTLPTEGFYRPALEAMACGCAVVCCDAVGNRTHCVAGETCLQPADADADEYANCVRALLADAGLRTRLRHAGQVLAARFASGKERVRLHALFDELR
jgi:glycosyltransferase involved in cell wall biosynthesis